MGGMTTMLAAAVLALAQGGGKGSIQGRISPEVNVRILAVPQGKDYSQPANVKGEVTLEKGGAFEIKGLAPGRYALHFQLKGADVGKYMGKNYGEIDVKAGQATEEIRHRLTPIDATHMIDEVIVTFAEGVGEAARAKTTADLGCRVKERSYVPDVWVVDIPDDRTVEEMVEAFKKAPGVKLVSRNGIARVQ
jgi:hypothetical protein